MRTKIKFIREYRDENYESNLPVPPIQIGQKGMLLDEVTGTVQLTGGDLDGIILEAVPHTVYGETK
jgi:hypothetical protein